MKKKVLCLLLVGMALLQGCGSTGANSDQSNIMETESAFVTQDMVNTEATEAIDYIMPDKSEDAGTEIDSQTESETDAGTETDKENASENECTEESSDSESSIYMTETTDELVNPELFYTVTIEGTDYDVPFDYSILVGYGFYAEDPDGSMQRHLDLLNDNYPDLILTVDTGISYYVKEDDLYEGGINAIEFREPWNGFPNGYLDIRIQGIGLYSTAEEVLEVFGQPNKCSESRVSNVDVTYRYETKDAIYGGALTASYELAFSISSEGYVVGIDFSGPAQ